MGLDPLIEECRVQLLAKATRLIKRDSAIASYEAKGIAQNAKLFTRQVYGLRRVARISHCQNPIAYRGGLFYKRLMNQKTFERELRRMRQQAMIAIRAGADRKNDFCVKVPHGGYLAWLYGLPTIRLDDQWFDLATPDIALYWVKLSRQEGGF